MHKTIIAFIASIMTYTASAGQLITEIGGGWLTPAVGTLRSSYVLDPLCKKVEVVDPLWPDNPRPPPQTFSCGGDNPAFIGWPIAYEFGKDENIRVGWFHFSHWFDNKGETQFNCICASYKINWKTFGRRNR